MKVSEFLNGLDGHGIYDADGLAKDFTNQTGLEPCWPTHSISATAKAIGDRGLGGHVSGEGKTAWGYEVAAALAAKLCDYHSPMNGRGSLFRDCRDHLKENGF